MFLPGFSMEARLVALTITFQELVKNELLQKVWG